MPASDRRARTSSSASSPAMRASSGTARLNRELRGARRRRPASTCRGRCLAGRLRTAEQQKIEILRALSRDAQLIVMDEPSAALGGEETQHLHEIIRKLAADGKTIILVSHFLREVLELADTVTVLRDGKLVKTAPTSEESEASLSRRCSDGRSPRRSRRSAAPARAPGRALGARASALRASSRRDARAARGRDPRPCRARRRRPDRARAGALRRGADHRRRGRARRRHDPGPQPAPEPAGGPRDDPRVPQGRRPHLPALDPRERDALAPRLADDRGRRAPPARAARSATRCSSAAMFAARATRRRSVLSPAATSRRCCSRGCCSAIRRS